MKQSQYLASVVGAGGAFFGELGLHGADKTSIEIEHLRLCILNFIKFYNRK